MLTLGERKTQKAVFLSLAFLLDVALWLCRADLYVTPAATSASATLSRNRRSFAAI